MSDRQLISLDGYIHLQQPALAKSIEDMVTMATCGIWRAETSEDMILYRIILSNLYQDMCYNTIIEI